MENLTHKPAVIVTGSFDNVRSGQIRFLHEASRLGRLHVMLWSDQTLLALNGREPKFPAVERQYFVENSRYVDGVSIAESPADENRLPESDWVRPGIIWAVGEEQDTPAKKNILFYPWHRLPGNYPP